MALNINVAQYLLRERDIEEEVKIKKGKKKSLFDAYVGMLKEISVKISVSENVN